MALLAGLPARDLRRAPVRRQPPLELAGQLADRDAVLDQGVAVADRDRAVLERLVVDGHAVGRADLVLAAVALADRPALVVLALEARALERGVDVAGDLRLAVL